MDNITMIAPPDQEAALDMADAVASGQEMTVTRSGGERALLPAPLEKLREVAMVISASLSVPVAFQGDPERCLSIAYQAALHRFDPVAFASKCYAMPVKGGGFRLAYEAQLLTAIINANAPITEPLDYEYHGEGQKRYCVCIAKRTSGKAIRHASPTLSQITVKNSPLWFTDPDQQLAYYTGRALARRHFPEVLMGMYAIDELKAVEVTDVGPRRDPLDPLELDDLEHVEVEVVPSGGWTTADQALARAARRPDAPSGGDGEAAAPDDIGELREWAMAEQSRILAVESARGLSKAASDLNAEPRWDRLVAYAPDVCKAINASFKARLADLKATPTEASAAPQ